MNIRPVKTYIGRIDPPTDWRVVVEEDAQGLVTPRPLRNRLDLRNHSPDGFSWGYGGSGPAQLALSLLADALGDDEQACRLYQGFKWFVIGGLDKDKPWAMSDTVIVRLAAIVEAQQIDQGAA